jgi:hypothetical protein
MISIHFKHENYQPVFMKKQEGEEFPSVTLMVPNGRVFYFFLVEFEIDLLQEAPSAHLSESENVVSHFLIKFILNGLRSSNTWMKNMNTRLIR